MLFVVGMVFWSYQCSNWSEIFISGDFVEKLPVSMISMAMIVIGLLLVSTEAYNMGLGHPQKQDNLIDGHYYELVCQGTKDNERVAVLNHLGNDGIRAYYLNELLPEGKKYYKAVKDKTTNNGKTLLVPTE